MKKAIFTLLMLGLVAGNAYSLEPTVTVRMPQQKGNAVTQQSMPTADFQSSMTVVDKFTPLEITNFKLGDCEVNKEYPLTNVTAKAGTGAFPFYCSVIINDAPGIIISQNRENNGCDIQGNPSKSGTFDIILQIKDSAGATDVKGFHIKITDPPIHIWPLVIANLFTKRVQLGVTAERNSKTSLQNTSTPNTFQTGNLYDLSALYSLPIYNLLNPTSTDDQEKNANPMGKALKIYLGIDNGNTISQLSTGTAQIQINNTTSWKTGVDFKFTLDDLNKAIR